MPEDPDIERLRDALDPDVALTGENVDSRDPADVRHWLRVYGELIALKDELLGRADAMRTDLSDDAVEETEIDQTIMSRQREKYRHRLHFWQARAEEISGA